MRYIHEAYTPEMDRIFKPFLKTIADKLSKKGISIQDAEFSEIELPKPVALSSVNKIIRAQYEVYGRFDCVLALLKHSTGGVSVGSFYNTGRGKVSAIEVHDEFGDTDGKVTDAFVTELTNSDYQKVRNLRSSREEANAPYRDSHDVSKRIKAQMSYFDNPVLKEVVKRAKAAGIENLAGKFYSVQYKDETKFYLSSECTMLHAKMDLLKGNFNNYIYVEPSEHVFFGGDGHSAYENLDFVVNLNGVRFSDVTSSRSEKVTDLDELVRNVDKFVDNLEKINDFVRYLNSLTYSDILWYKYKG